MNQTIVMLNTFSSIFQLNQQSHSESEVKEDDDHETTGSLNASEAGGENKDAQKRKKKKKKKKCSSKAQNPRSSEDNFEVSLTLFSTAYLTIFHGKKKHFV